jgi:hypothetical protein
MHPQSQAGGGGKEEEEEEEEEDMEIATGLLGSCARKLPPTIFY